MTKQTSEKNILLRVFFVAFIFGGSLIYYIYKYGFNFSFQGIQGIFLVIGMGTFASLLFGIYKIKDQIF